MQAISQNEVIALVTDINSFADRAENLIKSTQNSYQSEKERMIHSHSAEISNLDSSYKANCDAVRRKSQGKIGRAHV